MPISTRDKVIKIIIHCCLFIFFVFSLRKNIHLNHMRCEAADLFRHKKNSPSRIPYGKYSCKRTHRILLLLFMKKFRKSESWLNSDNFNDKYPLHNCFHLHKCTQIRWNSLISHIFVLNVCVCVSDWMSEWVCFFCRFCFGMTINFSLVFFLHLIRTKTMRERKKMWSKFTACWKLNACRCISVEFFKAVDGLHSRKNFSHSNRI